MSDKTVVIVGGTGGIGREMAKHFRDQGQDVIITGRDADKTSAIAAELGLSGLAFDLAKPSTIGPALEGVGRVDWLVLAAIQRDNNPVEDYNAETAAYLTTLKLVGYTETVHALMESFHDQSAVVLFGGRAKDRPYPGSTTVSSVNAGISGLVRTLVLQLAPVRVNAIHPGIVGDSPFWKGKPLDAVVERTPTGRLATMADIVDATEFLLKNPAINGIDLYVDAGWMLG